MANQNLDELCINTIRTLSADAVQKADSGHPGMPMGAAPMAHVLWTRFLNFNPKDPGWANRDRFVLSAGHGCMLQYSLLHLTGYGVTMDDIKNFRQLHSITPGHPEYGLTPGIEITTGPLGQGFANGVGMAIAQKYLAARYNRSDHDIFDYRIFAICSDGDLMEGISSESASIAGHMKLGNLIYLYDDNNISIEGSTELAFTEEVDGRFRAFGWHVEVVEDGNDLDAIHQAIEKSIEVKDQPSLIKIRTQIAFGSPNKVNTAGAHGSPLGEEEVRKTKEFLGWDPDKKFYVPDEVREFYDNCIKKGKEKQDEWNKLYQSYKEKYADMAEEYEFFRHNKMPEGWKKDLPTFKPNEGSMATRKASAKALNAIAPYFPTMIGGAADLAPSTNTEIKGSESFSAKHYDGRNLHYGVREHAMGAIVNGICVTEGMIGYGATFLIFSDYMRPPIRLAAIMKLRSIFVFTHDSIGLGEDGTTHQPVEQLMCLRAIPNVTTIRPADANETVQAWRVTMEHKNGPVALILTRQGVPVINYENCQSSENLEKGAYVLKDADDKPQLILIASGSEVHVALEAQEQLKKEGIQARVVSMPSWELFERQNEAYKRSVFPPEIRKRISIEAGASFGWHKYVTDEGAIIGVDANMYGESAPGEELMKEFGFTPDNVVRHAKRLLDKPNA